MFNRHLHFNATSFCLTLKTFVSARALAGCPLLLLLLLTTLVTGSQFFNLKHFEKLATGVVRKKSKDFCIQHLCFLSLLQGRRVLPNNKLPGSALDWLSRAKQSLVLDLWGKEKRRTRKRRDTFPNQTLKLSSFSDKDRTIVWRDKVFWQSKKCFSAKLKSPAFSKS